MNAFAILLTFARLTKIAHTAEVEFWKNPDFSKTVMPESVPPALRKAARHHLGIAPIIVISTIPHPNRMKAKYLRALVGPAKKINCWKPQKTRNL
ncbi:hypothetical protein QF001_002488 [Paraburkholderia youngii]|uniref:Uncharacterized protein n=1 Tax=Paraburkholderia youngii TaxID=2782701 RepID=A0A7Y6JWQ9_9BURK|nr:hypothetical protein [Paraburkholderia youngii]NUY00160.1 hypothetical protein [Paraburkholderia youngii]